MNLEILKRNRGRTWRCVQYTVGCMWGSGSGGRLGVFTVRDGKTTLNPERSQEWSVR